MIKIYNTFSGRKEEFITRGDTVKMYVCGVTPYDSCHLGHAMSYIIFDTIRRYLEFRGYTVEYVQNFTDIDDKIIKRANQQGILTKDLVNEFIAQYFTDMDALNIKRAQFYPRATEEIPKIVELVSGLIRKGHAYQAGGDVYFRVTSDPEYGRLSHRNLDDMMAGARIEIGELKEHPLDFALWKASKPGEPYWESPWGQGRPGWHIECSAMSLKYLGDALDIHGGGQDLIFPHHENELAQSQSFTSVVPFVRYWMHNGLMQLGQDKMSKSSGLLVSISQALEKYGADTIRLWVLSSHYRSPIVYSDEVLGSMMKGVERLVRVAHVDISGGATYEIDVQRYREEFIQAMDDDFGTPQAVATLFDLAREINWGRDEGLDMGKGRETLVDLAGVLGLRLRYEPTVPTINSAVIKPLLAKYGIDRGEGINTSEDSILYINMLTGKRALLRREKKWGLADEIRNDLRGIGIILEDTPDGTTWEYRKP